MSQKKAQQKKLQTKSRSKLIERVRKGADYFYNIKPSDFTMGEVLLLKRYLELIKDLILQLDVKEIFYEEKGN